MFREKKQSGNISLALTYRPPYPWENMLKFLEGRAIRGIELVGDGEYRRAVRLPVSGGEPVSGWLRVRHRPEMNALEATVSESLLPVLPSVSAKIGRLFDLNCDPRAIYETLESMNEIKPGLCVLGTRLPGCFNSFEMAARAVLGQQISVKAAATLAARIVSAYGPAVPTGIEGLTRVFPTPENIAAMGEEISDNFGALGVTASRSLTIGRLAAIAAGGEIDFDICAQPEEEIKKLMSIRGIGSWTARYIAMRAMGWPDAFLETDAGIKKALPSCSARDLLKMAEAWRPWRSYATVNLWNSL